MAFVKFILEIKYALLFVIILLLGSIFFFRVNPILLPSVFSMSSTAEADIFETTILSTQLSNSKKLRGLNTIIIGDSSALMGVDAAQLSEGNVDSIFNLSTMGYVGPAGYRSILENYFENNEFLDNLIIQIHPIILSDNENNFTNFTYENQAIRKEMFYEFNFPNSGLQFFRRNIMGVILPTPLPGNYGEKYKFRRLLINHMKEHKGSMFDPAPDLKDELLGSKPINIMISEPVRRRLLILREFLDNNNHRIGRKMLIMTPTNLRSATPKEMDERVVASLTVSSLLGIDPKNIINPIEHLPDRFYVGYHHLSRDGQVLFTSLLKEKLSSENSYKSFLYEASKGWSIPKEMLYVDYSLQYFKESILK